MIDETTEFLSYMSKMHVTYYYNEQSFRYLAMYQ